MTLSEEDYLKSIYHLTGERGREITTNAIAMQTKTRASSVTDMLKKLAEKNLVRYKKYQGVTLTQKGKKSAAKIVRKHRLWEVFLAEKLNFSWDEVHEVAEQLEHIQSEKLVAQLDAFLNFPETDPHGDPIPNENGSLRAFQKTSLASCNVGERVVFSGIKDSSSAFLKYLDRLNMALGDTLEVLAKEPFDGSMRVLHKNTEINLSVLVTHHIYIKK